jgi:hypothetical protein
MTSPTPSQPMTTPVTADEARRQYAEDWKRQIINAGGDENIAQQTVALAALNGLFDHIAPAQLPASPVAVNAKALAREIEQAWDSEPTPFNRADVAARVILSSIPAQSTPSCRYCNGTGKALYFSEQGWTQEWRACHVCRPSTSSAPGGHTWQPIETAPKDGTRLLLCHATSAMHANALPVLTGHWSLLSDCWFSTITDDRVNPTHWMPLPAAPTVVTSPNGGEA